MTPVLTFVIPVRHPENAASWEVLRTNLSQTLKSIAAQTTDRWKVVVVANEGSELPALPRNGDVKYVDFEPNPAFERGRYSREEHFEIFRWDKGRRVLAGMLHAGATDYFMVVDDDDLVSCHLATFVAQNMGRNGWFIRDGYVWQDGGALVYRHPNFSGLCGTSLIIRADLYRLPSLAERADPAYIRRMLGAHRFASADLAARGASLEPLPFRGAIYRVGHVGAHSQSSGLLKTFIFRRELMWRPLELARRLWRLRPLSRSIQREFWGVAPVGEPHG